MLPHVPGAHRACVAPAEAQRVTSQGNCHTLVRLWQQLRRPCCFGHVRTKGMSHG